MELISIVITTYKGEDSIKDCVKSAFSQDYNNFEIIVVDDNGKDSLEQKNTESLLKEFNSSKNFKYIVHQKNINGSAARNTGIKNSHGKYIAFLDDDDILMNNSIRLRYEKLSHMSDDYGIVFSSFVQYIDHKKDFECVHTFDGDILEDYLMEKIHSPSSILMIRRSVIDNVGMWDEEFRRHQDWEYVTRVLRKYKACSIPNISVQRNVTWRNNAKNPELYEEQRMFFLEKMKPIIGQLEETTRKKIYYTHYIDIGKNYLKFKKVRRALKWAIKSGMPISAIFTYLRSLMKYISKITKRRYFNG